MSTWILSISIGPVAGFIGAGRASRDLWWGSTWVSECTIAVAKQAQERGGALLLPSPNRLSQLEQERAQGKSSAYGGRVSNHVIAQVEGDTEQVSALARELQQIANNWLADTVQNNLRVIQSGLLDKDATDQQVQALRDGDFIEFSAVWVEVTGGDIAEAWKQANERLGRRKLTRDFRQASGTPGYYKSDLEPGRQSVVRPTEEARAFGSSGSGSAGAILKLRVSPGEHLDALSLARRLAKFGGGAELDLLPFPPTTRVAAQAWIERVNRDDGTGLKALSDAIGGLKKNDHFPLWCSRATLGDDDPFPWEAGILFEGGLEAAKKLVERAGGDTKPMQALGDRLAPLVNKHGPPPPYYALIFADGDGVGRLLEERLERHGVDGYLELVKRLDSFADQVAKQFKDHQGVAFYTGGDDIAGYAPLHKITELLKALIELYNNSVVYHYDHQTSLTGAVIIGHCRDDLRMLRDRARQEEKRAKKARKKAIEKDPSSSKEGYLSVCEVVRNGTDRRVVGPWQATISNLERWCDRLSDDEGLTLRSVERLLELGGYEDPSDGPAQTEGAGSVASTPSSDTRAPAPALAEEAACSVARGELAQRLKRGGRRDEHGELWRDDRAALKGLRSLQDLRQLAATLRIANRLRVAHKLAGTQPAAKNTGVQR